MKRSAVVTLLCLTTVVAGLATGCRRTQPNQLRPRFRADGTAMLDAAGNPLYEDDEGQHYTHAGGFWHPWYTRGNGFSSIPGTSTAAPESSAGVTRSSITGRSISRGGFGGFGFSRSGS